MSPSIRHTPSVRQNKRKSSFSFAVFNPTSPMTHHDFPLPQKSETPNADTSPTHKAQKHNNTPSQDTVEIHIERLVKVGPRTARVGSRASRVPPVTMESILRSQISPDPLDQIYDAVYMHASATTPAQFPYSPSLGFGGLSLTSPSPGNALGLITGSPAEPQPLPSFREALAMSRHASDADITGLPFGTTSYDSRSTLVSNPSFDTLYSPNMQSYHGSSSICFPPLPTPPPLWSSLARGNKELPDPFSEQFADAEVEDGTHAELHRQSLSELRRGSTSQMPGPSNLFNQGRADPHSQTMPQMAPPELPRVRSPSFRGDTFVFPAPPKTLPGGHSVRPDEANTRPPPPAFPPPLLPASYVAKTKEPTAGPSTSKLSAGFGRFWKLGFKSDRDPAKKASTLLPQVNELRTLPPVETSPERSLRIVDESIFDFSRYAADEEEEEQQSTDRLEDSVEVELEDAEEEITMDSLERMAGPFDQQEITMDSLKGMTDDYGDDEDDEDYDNVSEDDFPGCGTFQLRMRSDPGYPTEGDWNHESQRYAYNKERKELEGPNPARVALQELAGALLHPEFVRKYTVIEELGSGGYGFVCVAIDREGREVAVKFIRKFRDPAAYPLAMAHGEPLECFVLRSIKHPNIVSYIEQFEDDKFYYLVSFPLVPWVESHTDCQVQELHGDPWHRARLGARNDEDEDPARMDLAQIQIATRHYMGTLPDSGPSSSTGTPVLSPALSGSPFTPFLRPGMQRRASYDLFEAIEHREFTEFQCRHIFKQLGEYFIH